MDRDLGIAGAPVKPMKEFNLDNTSKIEAIEVGISDCIREVNEQVNLMASKWDRRTPEVMQGKVLFVIQKQQAERLLKITSIPDVILDIKHRKVIKLTEELCEKLEKLESGGIMNADAASDPLMLELGSSVVAWLGQCHQAMLGCRIN